MGTPLQKNGHDGAQDKALRELREAIDKQREADLEAHSIIMEKLSLFDKDLLVTHVREEERLTAEKSLRKQVFALTLMFLSMVAGLVAWVATELNEIHDQVHENTAHFREFQGIGIRWGEDIDARDKAMAEDIRQLERIVNEHQRNKKEHQR